MSWEQIRPVALGVPFRDDEILLARHHDEVAELEFYRPLGGGVEFREESHVGVRREFQEELGTDVTVTDRLGTFENIFEFRGTPGHEVVFLYEVELQNDMYYEQDAFQAIEGTGETFPARWKPISDFEGKDSDTLYPDGVLEHVRPD